MTLHNRSGRPRRIEITSFAEVVLHAAAAYRAHPAFSKLFLQTEFVPEAQAVLVQRRARAAGERHPWLIHALAGSGHVEFETDRSRFIGRGSSLESPAAMRSRAPLAGSTGDVIDPIVSLRTTVDLRPGARTQLTFLLGTGSGRTATLALGHRYLRAADVDAAFVDAEGHERDLQSRFGITEVEASYLQALAGAMLYGHPGLRADPAVQARARGDLSTLAHHGLPIAGTIALLHAEEADGMALLPAVLAARGYWRALGLEIDLVILTGPDSPPIPRSKPSDDRLHVLRVTDLTPPELDLIAAAARLVLRRAFPDLGPPLERNTGAGAPHPESAAMEPPRAGAGPVSNTPAPPGDAPDPAESLRFENDHGGFNADGTEYVIRLTPDRDRLQLPPRPWINVIANDSFGFLASETGAGTTWSRNSREHRLTPWCNDPLLDPHEEAFYVRDEATGEFWSPLPGPSPHGAASGQVTPYEMRHGFGYSTCRLLAAGLQQEATQFVPLADPVKITMLRLRNMSDELRSLSLFAYYRLVLGTTPEETGRFITVTADAKPPVLLATNPLAAEFGDGVAFAAVAAPAASAHWFSGDRVSFLGRHGHLSSPAALRAPAPLDGHTGAGLDPCFAEQVTLELPPGTEITLSFLCGEAPSPDGARALVARYSGPDAALAALATVRSFWKRRLGAIQVTTPSPALDLMVNGWLPYQTLSCRLWGRSALYQSGGAFGFRDQLQDAAALIPFFPALTRAQILLHAAHQFADGDVLHWWHPPLSKGIRTRFSDDLLWLPYLTAYYVATTGDAAILDENVRFLTARELAPGEDEAFLVPTPAGESADLYKHCCRALDRGLTRGAHGLPLFGTGDWNDGMNRVGREGRGESVWLGFFQVALLGDFIPICAERGDEERARRYRAYRDELVLALNDWAGTASGTVAATTTTGHRSARTRATNAGSMPWRRPGR